MMKKKTGVFYALERAYDISPRNDIKIVLGDFNVQVGKEAVRIPTIDNNGLHSLTERQLIPDDTVFSIAEYNHTIHMAPT
jgi:hypothetical protein